jgi:hypothetical protein
MADTFTGEAGKKKADGVADAINKLLQNLVIRCAKEEGVRDYFHVGVLGYGANVGPAFGGALAGKELAPISEIANSPARISDHKDGMGRRRDPGKMDKGQSAQPCGPHEFLAIVLLDAVCTPTSVNRTRRPSTRKYSGH